MPVTGSNGNIGLVSFSLSASPPVAVSVVLGIEVAGVETALVPGGPEAGAVPSGVLPPAAAAVVGCWAACVDGTFWVVVGAAVVRTVVVMVVVVGASVESETAWALIASVMACGMAGCGAGDGVAGA